MPTVDFWLDWSVGASVDQLRDLLPRLLEPLGYRIEERETFNTGPDWAQLAILAPEPVGIMRAQTAPDGRTQVFVGPGPARDEPSLQSLNRAAVQMYCELIRRGLLLPPPPLESPDPPLPET